MRITPTVLTEREDDKGEWFALGGAGNTITIEAARKPKIGRKELYVGDELVAEVDCIVVGDDVYVSWIGVSDDLQGRGYGAAITSDFLREWEGKRLWSSDLSTQGAALVRHMGFRVDLSGRVWPLQERAA